MFDARLRQVIDPSLNRAGHALAQRGVQANAVTVIGFVFGFLAFVALAFSMPLLALAFLVINRLCDGLDGAIARASSKTDLGGYLDIVLDFFFYGLFPLGFALADPQQNALAAAVLLFSFYANGSSFLAFSIMAEKRGLKTEAQGAKSLYYLGGLTEGGETIAVFCLMCLWPAAFAELAFVFAAACIMSAVARVAIATRALK